jgi:hypothetical protein
MEKTMKTKMTMAVIFALLPLALFAQGFRDLDGAMSAVARGFERGESQAIVAGIGESDQVMLQFPGLIPESGFFGRDQAAFLLEKLFQRANPAGFEQVSARKVSAEGQYHITASWTIRPNGGAEQRELYITLRQKGDRWTVAAIRSAGR